ncbi:MAG: anti-sigma factor [Gammaproteobacteria bacterium]|nr:anti-sigma factor [Gammaproteobacteria bacterium]
MSDMKDKIQDYEINAYVDGLMDANEREHFERLLKTDKAAFEKVQDYQKQNQMLHQLFDSVLDEPLPEKMRPKKKTSFVATWQIAAALILALVGGVIGWQIRDQQGTQLNLMVNLVQPATLAHHVYRSEVKHPVEVGVDQQQHLVKWLSKRLGKEIDAPNLTAEGFSLLGGRLLPGNNGAAAQFMYENTKGERLTLYVKNKDEKEQTIAFRFHQDEHGTRSFYWIDGDLGYVLSGDVPREQLHKAVNSVYQQLVF